MKLLLAFNSLAFCLFTFKAEPVEPVKPAEEQPFTFDYIRKHPSSAADADITKAINLIKEELLGRKKDLFFSTISAKDDFSYTVETPKEISEWLSKAQLKVTVRGYDGGKDTRTLAYVTSDYPNTIFINLSKAGRSPQSIANTLVHEVIHSLDRKREDARFGHGGNSASGKQNSAPYAIGAIAEGILRNDITADNNKKLVDDKALAAKLAGYEEGSIIEETESIDESRVKK